MPRPGGTGSTFFKRGDVDVPIAVLEMEVSLLKTGIAQKDEIRINQMEQLRQRMNAPYEVPDIQNYTVNIDVERERLHDINARISRC